MHQHRRRDGDEGEQEQGTQGQVAVHLQFR
jgi:hypothetical protein